MKYKYIYLCGPTVYDKVHIGNLRPIITFDIFIRARRFNNEKIHFIHNITDIDDKIIQKAKDEKVTEKEISEKYFNLYLKILDIYNINSIDEMPLVTDKINQITNFIDLLIDKNVTYKNKTGIYLQVDKDQKYGNISNNKLNDLLTQNKNQLNKENDYDFCLWKLKNNEIDKSFPSSFGKGRPGWHTECAAFVFNITNGESLDIHGGGIDLKFPHHENENSQFRLITKSEIANEWIHIGIVNLNSKKMSKSENNLLFAEDYLKYSEGYEFNPDILRLIFLNSNYKSTINFDESLYEQNKKQLKSLLRIKKILILEKKYKSEIKMNNDFKEIINLFSSIENAKALKLLNSFIKEFNKTKDQNLGNQILNIFNILGFKFPEYKIDEELIILYNNWNLALKKKNFEEADNLRNILLEKEII
ncbi:MAG: class I tRNA ligase family protein [Metamycoplasmataceae bacterium]